MKIRRDKILMPLFMAPPPHVCSLLLTAVKVIIGGTLCCSEVYLLEIQSCLCQTGLSNSPRDTQQLRDDEK